MIAQIYDAENSGSTSSTEISLPRTSVCEKCAVPFDRCYTYVEHVAKCPAIDIASYRKHLHDTFVPGKPFPCSACSLPRLEEKELWESEEKTLQCLMCSGLFIVDSALHMHKNADGRTMCGLCGLVVDSANTHKHVLKHLNIRSCLLKLCSTECAMKHTAGFKLNETDKFKLFCPVCFKSKQNPTGFRFHMEGHFGFCYTCDVCRARFKNMNDIRVHLRKYHGSQFDQRSLMFRKVDPRSILNCDHCYAKFTCKSDIKEHIDTVHFRICLDNPLDQNQSALVMSQKIHSEQIIYSSLKYLFPPYNTSLSSAKYYDCRTKDRHKITAKDYYTSTFQKGVAFPRLPASAKRRTDLEIMPPLANSIPCGNCKKEFLADLSLPVYESDSGLIMCGYCNDVVYPSSVYLHQYEHIATRSFLFDICSNACLNALMDVLPSSFRKYKCIVCFQQFVRSENWKNHHSVHLPESQWNHVCQKCGRRFPIGQRLKTHMSTHLTGYPCPYCLQSLSHITNLEIHIRVVHGIKRKVSCLTCEETFEKPGGYSAHLRLCMSNNPNAYLVEDDTSLDCLYCKSSFPDLASITDHKATCASILRCYHCGVTTRSLAGLREHILRAHLGKVNLKTCETCGLQVRKHSYWHHMRIHRKPNDTQCPVSVCEVCGSQFKTVQAHYAHMVAKHRKPDRFKCDQCPKSFGLQHHLKQHVYYNHTTDFPFQCSQCCKKFRRKSNVRDHEKRCFVKLRS